HRQLIILNTPVSKEPGVFTYRKLLNELIDFEGNPTEIQKNLESWLPSKSTGLTYRKEIYKSQILLRELF
ncbi:hypothetical protein ACNQO9_15225, partial [Acinetobacter calcoaceticus]